MRKQPNQTCLEVEQWSMMQFFVTTIEDRITRAFLGSSAMLRTVVDCIFRVLGNFYVFHRTACLVHNSLTRWATEPLMDPVAVHCRNGNTMYVLPNELIGRQIYYTRSWDPHLLEILERLARGSRTIIDVGANIGFFTLAMARAAPEATVHAFEPQEDLADLLQRSVEASNLANVVLHTCGLSDIDGTATLAIDRENRGGSHIPGETEAQWTGESRVIRIQDTEAFLDSEGIRNVELMKMDIEGHEPVVLRSLKQRLETKSIRTLLFESRHCEDATSLLKDSGYELFGISKRLFRPVLVPVSSLAQAACFEDMLAVCPMATERFRAILAKYIAR